MRIVFDEHDLTFRLYYEQNIEARQAVISFERKIRGWQFKTKHIKGGWKGDVQFISAQNKLPAGLWGELQAMCKQYQYPLKVENFNKFLRHDIDFVDIKDFCDNLRRKWNEMVPKDQQFADRPYQAQAVYLMLKYRLAMVDLATSAGKTWIMFLYYAYVIKHLGGQALIIEPDPAYVIQSYSEINSFALMTKTAMRIGMVSGTSTLRESGGHDLIIGNFQTLANLCPLNKNKQPVDEFGFYKDFKYVIIDEGHRAKAISIKNIIKMCIKSKDHVGLSGTVINDKSADHYEILAATGPTVIRVSKKDLMDAGYAPGIKIKIYVLDYLTQEERKAIAFLKESQTKVEIDLYNHELSVMRNSKIRLRWLTELVAKLPMNTLTFFTDVQGEYGKRIYDGVRQMSHTKELFYIDGGTKDEMRELYRKKMEEGYNKSLIATYGTYGTGKSIKNLHYFVCGEPMKSEVIIGQGIGRGMRQFADKDEFHWIDVVDDFRWKGIMNDEHISFTNILYRQMRDRIKIYEDEGFQYEIIKVKLDPNSLNQPNLF